MIESLPGVRNNVSLKPFTTLKAGGPAEWFAEVDTLNDFERLARISQDSGAWMTILGWGSNVLPSDRGVPGLVLHNRCAGIEVTSDGEVVAETGCSFQMLFLKTAQAGLSGLEFAVGIPGTLGGALVSNAGAYRNSIAPWIREIEVVQGGVRKWLDPAFMKFAYRNSILRAPDPPAIALLRVALKLEAGDPKAIYESAKDFQRQRIRKQPPQASAGSFFKNVYDGKLAAKLTTLPTELQEKGIVPAGYLIEAVGLKGYRLGGAMFSSRHANFIVNVNNATATEIRDLASIAKRRVELEFGVLMEEEVLYLGDWMHYFPIRPKGEA